MELLSGKVKLRLHYLFKTYSFRVHPHLKLMKKNVGTVSLMTQGWIRSSNIKRSLEWQWEMLLLSLSSSILSLLLVLPCLVSEGQMGWFNSILFHFTVCYELKCSCSKLIYGYPNSQDLKMTLLWIGPLETKWAESGKGHIEAK